MLKAIHLDKCVKCNSCMVARPPQYKAVVKISPPLAVEKEEGAQKVKGKVTITIDGQQYQVPEGKNCFGRRWTAESTFRTCAA